MFVWPGSLAASGVKAFNGVGVTGRDVVADNRHWPGRGKTGQATVVGYYYY